MTCADVDLLAGEAAFGLVSGAERAELLAHLDTCDRCRALVLELAEVADAVVVAGPEAEPPSGFEQRVLAQFDVVRPRRRWPVVVGSVAAAVLLVVAFGLGRTGSGSSQFREVAMQTPSGRTVGEAYLHSGSPSWVFADVPGWTGDGTKFQLEVTLADGTTMHDTGGAGSWGVLVPDSRQVRTVALIDDNGQVWCSVSI
ncbi:MAG TPA: zf-HC2 domain-containing protein [Acidimicrobiales bacterium]|nr:zf-HC2 domain-containing protein [Acidimicrobiales bacterium]